MNLVNFRLVRPLISLSAFFALASLASAINTNNNPNVQYNSPTYTVQGNMQFVDGPNASTTVQVTAPTVASGNYNLTVTIYTALPTTGVPFPSVGSNGQTAAQLNAASLAFITLSGTGVAQVSQSVYTVPYTYNAAAPTPLILSFAENVPLGNFAGNFGYYVSVTGWPATDTAGQAVVPGWFTIDCTVRPPLPTINIATPMNGATITIPSGQSTTSVNYDVEATTVSGTTFGTAGSVTATLTNSAGAAVSAFAPTFTGIGTSAVTTNIGTSGSNAAVILGPGTYTLSASDYNNLGGTAGPATATFHVVAAAGPTISINSPANGAVFSANTNSGSATVPFTIVGNTTTGLISLASASMVQNLTGGGTAAVPTFAGVFTGLLAQTATDTGNINLPPGSYTINATDSSVSLLGGPLLGTANATPVTFTVLAGPTISITGPTSGQVFDVAVGNTTVAVPYVITGSTVAGTTFVSSASATAALTSSTGASTSGFAPSFTVSTGTAGASTAIGATGSVNLAPGTYTINATDTNNDGGSDTATPVTFTVIGLPSITIGSPGNNSTYSAGASGTASVPYTITGSTTTGTLLSSASATLTDNGTLVNTFLPTFSGLPPTAGTSTTASGTLSLAPGTYVLNATDANNSGGTATATAVTFTVIGAPNISIGTPSNNAVYSVSATTGTAPVTWSITGGTPTGSLLATATASMTSNGSAVSAFAPTFSGLPPSAGTTTTAAGTTNLGPGTYTITASDTNNDGGSATATQVTFTVLGPPAITIGSPSNGQIIYIPSGSTTAAVSYTISGTTISGTTFPTASSATAALSLPSGSTGSLAGVTQPTFTGYSATSTSVSSSGTFTLTAGTYTLSASDNNNVGGTATATPVTFTVATSAIPTITIGSPMNGQVVYIPSGATTAAVSYTINGTTPSGSTFPTASSGTATLAVAAGSASTGSVAGVAQPTFTGYGSTSVAIASAAIVNLPAGTYTLSASDTNSSGGSATATPVTFTVVGSVAPAITIGAPLNGATITIPSGSTTAAVSFTISGTTPSGSTFLSSSSATATLSSSTGGSTSGFTAAFAVGSPATTISATGTVNLAAGTYTINATDINNEQGTATATPVTFTVAGGTCSAPTVTTTGSFTGNASCKGNTLWFNSTVNVSGLSSAGGILEFNNSTVSFSSNGTPVTLVAPSAVITFSPTATTATSAYDAPSNTWNTTVPAGYTGNVFLTALSYAAPSNFNAGTGAVTWSGSFLGSAQNMSVQWMFTASILSQCSTNYNNCGVKPCDSGSICSYANSDTAGTCENYKSYNCGNACGSSGSGSNTSKVSISGLYTTGVSDTGALLTPGTSDPHYVITGDTAPNPNAYLGNSYVDLSPLAGGWVANTAAAQWVTAPGGTTGGNGAGKCNLPSSGGSGYNVFYFYTLTFSMPANANLSTATITGTLAADDAVQTIVDWTTVPSGVGQPSSASYNCTGNFTFNSSNATFVAGSNTITFAVFNLNPGPDPSGLLVSAISGTVSVPCTPVTVTYCAGLGGQSSKGAGSPPTVTPSNPVANATYTIAAGSSASVPVGFTAVSPANSGNITAVSATLDGNALALTTTSGVNSSATATGAATLSISTAGTYNLVYTGTNAYGSATAAVTFTVVVVQPPTIAITAPCNGATVTIPYGSTSVAVPYTLTGATTYATVSSASVTLNGSAVSTAPTLTGLNTASISGSGSLTLTAGSYTLAATDSNGVASASASVTFTVVQGACGGGYVGGNGVNNECLAWIQQSACNGQYGYNNGCNQNTTGGSIVPIAFSLFSNSSATNNCWGSTSSGTFVKDTSVVIAIYQIYSNNTSSTPVLYTYGANGPNPPYYSIANNQYLLEFPTAAGSNHYQVEVYTSGNSLQLLGCEDLYTSGSCLPSACNIGTNFHGQISAGHCLWFNSTVCVNGLSSHATTLWFDCSTITFNCGNTPVTINTPAACIKFDPNCSSATSTFDSVANCWVTDVPLNYSGNVFLCGVPYTVPSGFSAWNCSPNWTGCFRSDTGSCNVQWQWCASDYSQCGSSCSSVSVKPCDSGSWCQYNNSDCAGTPENYRNCLSSSYNGTNGFVGYVSPSVGASCWLDSSWSSTNNWNNGWNNNGWWW